MKIAFLTPEYPHSETGKSGGIGTSIKNLAVGLIAQHCSVRILVYGQKNDAEFDDNGILVQQIKNVKLKGLSWFLTRKKIEGIINDLYTNQKIDLVEAPDWTGITSFIAPKNCPIVIRLNGSDTYFCHLDNRPLKWINKFHEKRAIANADGHISVSKYTAEMTNQLFGLKKEFTIIPNSIDSSSFVNSQNDKSDLPIVLYFGTLIRKKGLLELPFIFNEVVAQDPTIKLYLVGRDASDIISENDSTWGMMQTLFSHAALANVTYFGGVPYDEMQNHIQKSTVCVFPTFAEALPVSWIEAMAMQKPVVASNIGWAEEVIDDGVDGFLVNPKEHNLYAKRILELLSDVQLQKKFGEEARKKVIRTFSKEVVAVKSLEFYKRYVNT